MGRPLLVAILLCLASASQATDQQGLGEEGLVSLGRELFFDSSLSRKRWC